MSFQFARRHSSLDRPCAQRGNPQQMATMSSDCVAQTSLPVRIASASVHVMRRSRSA